ncbi:hypothetical protein [Aminobacterium mobile]|jgi:hypothetical protein|uniref:hypothetical protein n=1 Tax=Aminobacterium mobile TaxID=81467 RepID=UPI000462ED3A|nr:hypothetical protein [Aminobacterium mobile]
MEKRILRVMRWLERCLYASRRKAWHNALSEMECARAELEEARQELWRLAACEEKAVHGKTTLGFVVKSLGLAFLFLCAISAPLSVPMQNAHRVLVADRSQEPVLEWLTIDEQALLTALRRNLSESNIEAMRQKGEEEEGKPYQLPRLDRGPTAVALRSEKSTIVETEGQRNIEGKENEKNISLDRILTLVQVGQKALRDQGPAIVVNRQ